MDTYMEVFRAVYYYMQAGGKGKCPQWGFERLKTKRPSLERSFLHYVLGWGQRIRTSID